MSFTVWFLAILLGVTFAALAISVAEVLVEREKLRSYKRVGSWYEKRVAELEQETALLASQVITAGALPIRNAMPIPDRDDGAVYAYDATGLVVEKLDPRDLPVE